MARSVRLAVPLCLLLVVSLTACGGGKKAQTATSTGGSAKTTAAAIRARLTKAGYAVDDSSTPGTQKFTKAKGQVDAFSVQADFTSPNSYHLGITVFATTPALDQYVKREAAAEKKELTDPNCKVEPGCETFFHAMQGPHPPIVERTLGTVLYMGVVDKPGAELPLHSFEALVALASGRAT